MAPRCFAWFVVSSVVFLAVACSTESTRQLSPQETLAYKQELVKEHNTEISTAQQHLFMYRPERTKAGLDAALEKYRDEFTARQRVDRAAASVEEQGLIEDVADEVIEEFVPSNAEG